MAVAIVGGAFAGLVGAAFIWVVEEGVHALWVELPEQLDIDPFDSWWSFAVPIAGGALIGLGQRYLGNVPIPIAEVLARFKRGDGVDPSLVPGAFALAAIALVAGGALGFEAALATIIGGLASGIGRRLGARGDDVRAAWGLGAGDDLPPRLRSAAGWLAALAGLLTFRWLPFGNLESNFRLDDFDGLPDPSNALVICVFAAIAVIPVAWGLHLVVRAEHATLVERSPVLFGVGGGLVLALLALPEQFVLFSGQPAIPSLGDLSSGELAYLTVAKWAALALLLLAGWRGGPIFPMFLSIGALGVLVCDPLGVPFDVAAVAGLSVVSAVFLRGRIFPALLLTLYAVPFSYSGVVLIVAGAAATGLLVAGELGVLPRDMHPISSDEPTAG